MAVVANIITVCSKRRARYEHSTCEVRSRTAIAEILAQPWYPNSTNVCCKERKRRSRRRKEWVALSLNVGKDVEDSTQAGWLAGWPAGWLACVPCLGLLLLPLPSRAAVSCL